MSSTEQISRSARVYGIAASLGPEPSYSRVKAEARRAGIRVDHLALARAANGMAAEITRMNRLESLHAYIAARAGRGASNMLNETEGEHDRMVSRLAGLVTVAYAMANLKNGGPGQGIEKLRREMAYQLRGIVADMIDHGQFVATYTRQRGKGY